MSAYVKQLTGIARQGIYSIRVDVNGVFYYYVLAAIRTKETMLKRLLAQPLQQMDFSQFGTILFSSKGTPPDARVAHMLRVRHGVDICFS